MFFLAIILCFSVLIGPHIRIDFSSDGAHCPAFFLLFFCVFILFCYKIFGFPLLVLTFPVILLLLCFSSYFFGSIYLLCFLCRFHFIFLVPFIYYVSSVDSISPIGSHLWNILPPRLSFTEPFPQLVLVSPRVSLVGSHLTQGFSGWFSSNSGFPQLVLDPGFLPLVPTYPILGFPALVLI